MHLKIAHLNALAHLLQAFGQLGYKAHLDGGIDGRTLLLTVSYTHLDVYKRQLPLLCLFSPAMVY